MKVCHGYRIFVIQFLTQYIKIKQYKSIVFPVVLYSFENWSLTLREKHRLCENRALKNFCAYEG
jgi:lipid-A-disaccharide synthase-like uncharacterized protein